MQAVILAVAAIACAGLGFVLGLRRHQAERNRLAVEHERVKADIELARLKAADKIRAARFKAIKVIAEAGKSSPSLDDALRLLREAEKACKVDGICGDE